MTKGASWRARRYALWHIMRQFICHDLPRHVMHMPQQGHVSVLAFLMPSRPFSAS